ncbi:MAG: hypothetical protein QOJ00_1978 [Actinomycetota bacterium]
MAFAFGNTEIIAGLLVHSVTAEGRYLHVDVYGGEDNVCGSIRFTCAKRNERASRLKVLERWARNDTPVTYVATGTTITLQNDKGLFGQQMEIVT